MGAQPVYISAKEAREAEQEARNQRLSFAHLLRADESKAPTSADVMRMRRIIAAAEPSAAYDEMLSEQTTQKLFGCGAFFSRAPAPNGAASQSEGMKQSASAGATADASPTSNYLKE